MPEISMHFSDSLQPVYRGIPKPLQPILKRDLQAGHYKELAPPKEEVIMTYTKPPYESSRNMIEKTLYQRTTSIHWHNVTLKIVELCNDVDSYQCYTVSDVHHQSGEFDSEVTMLILAN